MGTPLSTWIAELAAKDANQVDSASSSFRHSGSM
jgi:hypothetical protein